LKNQKLNFTILIFSVAMFVLTLVFWPVNIMLRRHYGDRLSLSMEYRRVRRLIPAVCILNIAFLAALGVWIRVAQDNIGLLGSHFDPRLRVLQLLALIDVLSALIGIWYFVRSWRELDLWFWTRVWNTLLMLACISYAFFLISWHFLTLSLNY
jgi:hypothetical protein